MLQVAIVDDEPLARKVLLNHLAQLPFVQVAGTCKNAFELSSLLHEQNIDLLLLDIDMPGLNGLDLVRSLAKAPMVIFVTAYPQFALESYELNALDYLMKPVALDRLLKALHKALDMKNLRGAASSQPLPESPSHPDQSLFVRSEGRWVRIDPRQIWLVEGVKDYVRLWSDKGRLVVHSTMKNMEEQLAQQAPFVRVHKSFLVNMDYVAELDSNSLKVGDQLIAIGATYREEVFRQLEGRKMR